MSISKQDVIDFFKNAIADLEGVAEGIVQNLPQLEQVIKDIEALVQAAKAGNNGS